MRPSAEREVRRGPFREDSGAVDGEGGRQSWGGVSAAAKLGAEEVEAAVRLLAVGMGRKEVEEERDSTTLM